MNNNPLSMTDPTGQWPSWSDVVNVACLGCVSAANAISNGAQQLKQQIARSTTHVLRKVGGIPYVGGLMNVGLLAGTQFGSAYGASTGDWGTVGQAHKQGAILTGTMWLGAEFGATGRMFGGGINGYLQAGNSAGFVRGFVSGGIPQDLGFTNAYLNNPWANVGIGIGRDATRGYIVGGREGIRDGIVLGQSTNAFGHLWGFASSGFSSPVFRDGAFFYQTKQNIFYEAITFGNVVSGPEALYTTRFQNTNPRDIWLNGHELAHANVQAPAMGAAYIPLHALSQGLGSLGLPGGYFLEETPFHPLPYGSRP